MSAHREAERLAREIDGRLRALPSRTAEGMRTVRREYSQRLAVAEAEFAIEVATRLMGLGDPLGRFVAYELISHHKAAFANLTLAQLMKLGEGLVSWSSVDGFACYLAGPVWREGRIADSVVRKWARSSDLWWRRAALVSTVALSRRGGVEDVRRVIAICAALVGDREDMVVKAMSWALREVAKKNPVRAREFLEEHRRELAARVIREVENKLRTGLKTPRI